MAKKVKEPTAASSTKARTTTPPPAQSASSANSGAAVSGRVFSLRWKVVLAFSGVMFLLSAGLVAFDHLRRQDQIREERLVYQDRTQNQLVNLLVQEQERLRQLARELINQPWLYSNVERGLDSASLQSLIDQRMPSSVGNWGISTVVLYDRNNRVLGQWDSDNVGHSRSTALLNWARQVNTSGLPNGGIVCPSQCWLYAVVALQLDGRQAGVTAIVRPLEPLLQRLQGQGRADIGILLPDSEETPQSPSERLQEINANGRLQRLLEIASEKTAFTENIPFNVENAGIPYQVLPLPLPLYGGNGTARVIFAEPLSSLARSSTLGIASVYLFGWLLITAVSVLITGGIIRRLVALRKLIPQIGELQFRAVWETLGQFRKSSGDEVDALAWELQPVLRTLGRHDEHISEQLRLLEQQTKTLARDREQFSSVLSTIAVAVITQDLQGKILSVNPAAQTLLGYKDSEMIGKDFFELLFPEGQPGLRWRIKEELGAHRHRQDHLSHEALTTCSDGSIRNLSWLHSRLLVRNSDDVLIVSVGVDVTDRRGNEARLAWMSDHDALTGLLNRRHFNEELEYILRSAKPNSGSGVLLLIHLDQYAQVLESHGQMSADLSLKVAARLLGSEAIGGELVARLGGEEFALLTRNIDGESALRLAGRINQTLFANPLILSDTRLPLSASVGVVLFPEHGNNLMELLGNADLALQKAKEQGGGRSHLHSEEDRTWERVRQRAFWKDKVSQALTNDRFVLHFQPIINLKSGNATYFEVLLRMMDAQGGVISAARFIEAAERGGMIHAVDRMVISKAFEALSVVNLRGLNVGFSINLSGHAFSDTQLVAHIRRTLEQHPLNPHNVIFEIAETATITDFSLANSVILQIKELGCRFALDNFGIGFSSFYYLKHLPVDFIKINGAFIRNLANNVDDQTLVRAIARTAEGFGKETIAESVETEAALDLLKEFGVDYAQGYYISKPLRAEDAFRKVEKDRELSGQKT